MNFLDPPAPSPRPAGVDPVVRRRRLAAARRALGAQDGRSRSVPAARDALGRAAAAEARSVADPWSTAIDHAASMLAHRAAGRGRDRRSRRSL